MKKWLTFLLLLITLAGTFYPCCLVDECSDEEITTDQKGNKQEREGSCSPFFACASCSAGIEMVKQFQLLQPVSIEHEHHEALVIINLTNHPSSFWQPPRSC